MEQKAGQPCYIWVKVGKAVPQHTYGGAREDRRYSSYSFTTSALDEGEWSASRPARALPPGKCYILAKFKFNLKPATVIYLPFRTKR
jgi:hypothetical protein